MPLVTVCIPAYKSERWLTTTLESVRRQTVADIQVLVGIEPVEQGPTIEICRRFAGDPRFRYAINPKQLGWGGNVRALLEQVETPFFVILFHDDWLHSRYLETLLPPLLERPESSVSYGDIRRIGTGGRKCLPLRDGDMAGQLLDFFLGRADAVPVRGVTRSTVLEGASFPTNEFGDFAVESEWTLHLLLRGRGFHVHRPLYVKRTFPGQAVSVSGAWHYTMPVGRLREALANHRRRLLAGVESADLTEEERRPIVLAAEATALHRYAQFAHGRFRLDDEQHERARWIRDETEATLEPEAAARVRWLVDWAEATDAGGSLRKLRPPQKLRVAVIGAGIQGVCTALELAERGYRVTLLESEEKPMNAASRWNEGKVHLGYLYAADPSLRTARRMLAGSLTFARGFERLTGSPLREEWLSDPFVYGVPAATLMGADRLAAHFEAVDGLLTAELNRNGGSYLGRRELPFSRPVEVDVHFDPDRVSHAFETAERAVDPHRVARELCTAMAAHSRITFLSSRTVDRVRRLDDGVLEVWPGENGLPGRFDAVVNAAGGSRLALDRSAGIEPPRRWLHRYKLAVNVEVPGLDPPSATLVHGPFGDVVRFVGDRLYISWYPLCRVAMSTKLQPADPEPGITQAKRIEIAEASWSELAAFVPALRAYHPDWERAIVRGGQIPAWGVTDVDDPASGLHTRFEIGVFSKDGYHSIDPGKYGMAPMYAQVVADRIGAGAWRR